MGGNLHTGEAGFDKTRHPEVTVHRQVKLKVHSTIHSVSSTFIVPMQYSTTYPIYTNKFAEPNIDIPISLAGAVVTRASVATRCVDVLQDGMVEQLDFPIEIAVSWARCGLPWFKGRARASKRGKRNDGDGNGWGSPHLARSSALRHGGQCRRLTVSLECVRRSSARWRPFHKTGLFILEPRNL